MLVQKYCWKKGVYFFEYCYGGLSELADLYVTLQLCGKHLGLLRLFFGWSLPPTVQKGVRPQGEQRQHPPRLVNANPR